MKKIRLDFLIILCVIIAAPLGFTIKSLYKTKKLEDKGQYSVQISLTDSIANLNHYNFKEHYRVVQESVKKDLKLAYFSSCAVFNRYKDDLILYNKNMYKETLLVQKSEEKENLLNWCLISYKYIDDDVGAKFTSEYYKTIGLNSLYGFKGDINLDKAETYLKLSTRLVENKETDYMINLIDKYKTIYPGFKDEYILPYIDNALKMKK